MSGEGERLSPCRRSIPPMSSGWLIQRRVSVSGRPLRKTCGAQAAATPASRQSPAPPGARPAYGNGQNYTYGMSLNHVRTDHQISPPSSRATRDPRRLSRTVEVSMSASACRRQGLRTLPHRRERQTASLCGGRLPGQAVSPTWSRPDRTVKIDQPSWDWTRPAYIPSSIT